MATRQELSDFLASIERMAFKQAVYAVRDDEAALDIVQDAMLKLSEKYSDKPAPEMVVDDVLEDALEERRQLRRQKVRNLWTTLLSSLQSSAGDRDGADHDPLDTLLPGEHTETAENAANIVESGQILKIIEAEIQRLPNRQREAFIMRYWQDMDVAETAAAMGCSEGSVKTHCSRATHTLATALRAKGISL